MSASDSTPLQCEACAYPLHGLAPDALCPECARPVRDSLPEALPGSPWQRRQHRAWWQTNYAVLRHPIHTFEHVRLGGRGEAWLLVANLLVAPLVAIATPFFAELLTNALTGEPIGLHWTDLVQLVIVVLLMGAALLAVCGAVEAIVAVLGSALGWPRAWRLARVVSAHASVGWILGGLTLPLVIFGWHASEHFGLWNEWPAGFAGLGRSRSWLFVAIKFAPLTVGTLGYLSLLAIGLRTCRRVRSPATTPADTAGAAP